ncbi:hypothetical protein KAJ27_03310 [bacterium]|nr:hypothetical protein [bacterium]
MAKNKTMTESQTYSRKTKLQVEHALKLHQAGKIKVAELEYRNILEMFPGQADALHLLAVLCSTDRIDEALRLEKLVIECEPEVEQYRKSFEIFLKIHNERSNKYKQLVGEGLKNKKKPDVYMDKLKQAIGCKPDEEGAYVLLARLYLSQNQHNKALTVLSDAQKIILNSTLILNNMGIIEEKRNNIDQALIYFNQALLINPDLPETMVNIANLYIWNEMVEKRDEALMLYEKSLLKSKEKHAIWNNIAVALAMESRSENIWEAIKYLKKALEFKSDYSDAWLNLGNNYKKLSYFKKSIECYDKVISIDSHYPEAYFGKSLSYLAMGDLKRGWENYNWRWKIKKCPKFRNFPSPLWQGADLKNKSILIWGEQGIGDEILYGTLIQDVIRLNPAKIGIECSFKLKDLFQRTFSETLCFEFPYKEAETNIEKYDYNVPFGNLAENFRNHLEDFPENGAYLTTGREKSIYWKKQLASFDKPVKIGISWRSSRTLFKNTYLFPNIEELLPILKLNGITFINLQYDECCDEIESIKNNYGIEIHDFEELDKKNDLDNVAALMNCLDLVISGGTTVGDLAGAVGVPNFIFWVFEKHETMLGTDRFPWYSQTRIFSQKNFEGWEPVMNRIAVEVSKKFQL